jgi:hypothetical protein
MDFLREAIDSSDLNRLRRYCYSLSARAAQERAGDKTVAVG